MQTVAAPKQPDTKIIAQDQSELLAQGDLFFLVESEDDYQAAGEYLTRNKAAQKKVKEIFKEPKEFLDKAHSAMCKAEKTFLDPLATREKGVKEGMGKYLMAKEIREKAEAEERRRKAEQEAEERRKKEEERLKAEQDRLAKEKEAQVEQAQVETEKIAVAMEAEGLTEAAQEVRQAAVEQVQIAKTEIQTIRETPILVTPMPFIIEPATMAGSRSKVAGISPKKEYEYTVHNLDQLPDEYWIQDDKKIQGVVDALGLKANIPGVTVTEKYNISARAKG